MRAIFFGTPQLAVPTLRALATQQTVSLVVCQPDRPSGRGLREKPPAVKTAAEELGIPVLQPVKVRTPAFAARLEEEQADVAVVAAYGRILPAAVLNAPRRGCVNVHASLLPRWRGAGPIQWAIIEGDEETGVSLMQMDQGMDTGPVIAMRKTPIGPDENAGELGERLAVLGAELTAEVLPAWCAGEVRARPQPDVGVTMAPLLDKEVGHVDWTLPARRIHNLIRGTHPWPGAFSHVRDPAGERTHRVKLHRSRLLGETGGDDAPGTLRWTDDGLEVACGQGRLSLLELQLEGRRRQNAEAFVHGHPWMSGATFEL